MRPGEIALVDLVVQHPELRPVLTSSAGHNQAAHDITALLADTEHPLTIGEAAVRRWRRGNLGEMDVTQTAADDTEEDGQQFTTDDRTALHERLDELLDRAQADPTTVSGFKIAAWDTTAVNKATGEVETHRNYGLRLGVAEKMLPSWPVVQPASPIVIKPVQRAAATRRNKEKTALILPDPQIGYRFYADTGEYDPFHDLAAIGIAMQILSDLQPELVVWLGDYLDLAPFSHFDQEPAFAQTTQRAVNYGHQLLAQVRATSPNSKVVVMEGNHDRRLQKMVTKNAMEAFGLRRAADTTGWPVLSVPSLLRFDDLEVEYVGAYPAGSYWINERLKCVHGSLVRSGGSTALAVVNEERVSTIFGHVHRIETQYRTSDVHDGGSARLAHTCGCLCRIDGAVPSVKGSTDLTGRPVIHYENWQQGLSVVSFREGDNPFNLETAFINTFDGYVTSFGGRLYRP